MYTATDDEKDEETYLTFDEFKKIDFGLQNNERFKIIDNMIEFLSGTN